MLLANLPTGQPAEIAAIDWAQMPDHEGQRLRALGIDEGSIVTIRYRGILFGRDPLAVQVGRMTIAMRKLHANAIAVKTAQSLQDRPMDIPSVADAPAGRRA